MNSSVRLTSLPDDDRVWVLLWLGPFAFVPATLSQYLVQGVLGRLRTDTLSSLEAQQFDVFRLVRFAVGDLPMLSPGLTFRKQRSIQLRKFPLQRLTCETDFSQQRYFRLNDAPPLLRLDLPATVEDAISHSALTALPWNSDPYGLCIPVTEVLRWCYGSSSRLLQAVLSQRLPNLIDTVRHLGTFGAQADLTLPPGFGPEDAHTLAWLATDPLARARAEYVHTGLSAHFNVASNLSAPSAFFPHQGKRRIEVLGRWVHRPDSPNLQRFLVYRILHLDFRLPFAVTLPGPDGTSPDPGDAEPRPGAAPAVRPSRSALSSTQEPRRPGQARLPTALSSQFSGDVPRRRPQYTPASSAHFGITASGGLLSTGQGSDAASSARQVNITRSSEQAPPTPHILRDDLGSLRKVTELLQSRGMTATPISIPPRYGEVLTIELRSHHRYAYLLDRQEDGALLIAVRDQGRAAELPQLLPLITTREGRRSWPSTAPGWTLHSMAHNFSDDARFAGAILGYLNINKLI